MRHRASFPLSNGVVIPRSGGKVWRGPLTPARPQQQTRETPVPPMSLRILTLATVSGRSRPWLACRPVPRQGGSSAISARTSTISPRASRSPSGRRPRPPTRRRSSSTLTVCADPGNMPLSNIKGEGFQNKMAEVLGDALGAQRQSFNWRPFLERGLTRQTFDQGMCDVMFDMPCQLRPAAHHGSGLQDDLCAGLSQRQRP